MRLLSAKTQAMLLTIIKLRFAAKESGKSRFRFSQNGQLARIADSSIAQDGVRSKDSFYPRRSVSVFSETWVSQVTRILRTTNAKGERSHSNPLSRMLGTATRSGSQSPKRSKSFQCDLMGDASKAKTYMKWYYNYLRVVVEKTFNKKLLACVCVCVCV